MDAWLKQAAAADAAEDAEYGADARGDETPDWMADKQRRLERIRQANAELEAEAEQDPDLDSDRPGPSSGMQERGRRKRARAGGPPDKAQRNFTDPGSRIQPSKDGFIAGYNGQIAVDQAHQVIVAQRLSTTPPQLFRPCPPGRSDRDQSGPQAKRNLRRHRLRHRSQRRRHGRAQH